MMVLVSATPCNLWTFRQRWVLEWGRAP
jgi:hypothetical protein